MKFARLLLAFLAFTVCAAAPLTAQQAPLQVAFTFDDLPAHGPLPPGEYRPEPIRSIIKTLKIEHMPPVYGFVNGFRTAEYPYQTELLREWIASGNPLGNHTWSHPSLDKSSAKKYIHNIAENEPLLREGRSARRLALVPLSLPGRGRHAGQAGRGARLPARPSLQDRRGHIWILATTCGTTPTRAAPSKQDDAAIASLHDSYLATADEYITYSRTLSQRLYGRDIPYVLLLHVGAFDAKMLPELIALFRKRGFQFVYAAASRIRPGLQRRSEGGLPRRRPADGARRRTTRNVNTSQCDRA